MNLSRLDDTLMEGSWVLRSDPSHLSKPSRDTPAKHIERNLHDAGTSVGHFNSEFMEDGH
jgi:hypothetical protein